MDIQLPDGLTSTDKDWHRFDFVANGKMYMGVIVGRYPDGHYCYMGDVFQDKPIFMPLLGDFVDEYFDPETCKVPPAYEKYVKAS